MTNEQRSNLRAGSACFGRILLVTGLVALILFCLTGLQNCYVTDGGGDHKYLKTRQTLKELRLAIETYELEFNCLPAPPLGLDMQNFVARSRGPFLASLLGKEGMPDNYQIKFINPPPAINHSSGLWKDGTERVLSDPWGEPYYIVIDTNKDDQIANPEFDAGQSSPEYTKHQRSDPGPAMLPLKSLVYSSGPDRDPKTWQDNICSWRPK
jgi:hypothetical protein